MVVAAVVSRAAPILEARVEAIPVSTLRMASAAVVAVAVLVLLAARPRVVMAVNTAVVAPALVQALVS